MTGPQGDWFCHMVRCKDGSFYVGIALDVDDRVKRHNWGVGPDYTARHRPVELVWQGRCGDSKAARKREKEIKGWGRKKKLGLIEQAQGGPLGQKTAGKPFAPKTGSG